MQKRRAPAADTPPPARPCSTHADAEPTEAREPLRETHVGHVSHHTWTWPRRMSPGPCRLPRAPRSARATARASTTPVDAQRRHTTLPPRAEGLPAPLDCAAATPRHSSTLQPPLASFKRRSTARRPPRGRPSASRRGHPCRRPWLRSTWPRRRTTSPPAISGNQW